MPKQGNNNNRTLIFRGDILPKPRKEFISLIKYSVDDVLLTGDQSITDAFSCCQKKVIWYQIAPWKKNFAKQMAIHIPNKYFRYLDGLDYLIIDCLKTDKHPSHFNYNDAIRISEKINPKKTILTNLHVDFDYKKLKQKLPSNIIPAYDGLNFNF